MSLKEQKSCSAKASTIFRVSSSQHKSHSNILIYETCYGKLLKGLLTHTSYYFEKLNLENFLWFFYKIVYDRNSLAHDIDYILSILDYFDNYKYILSDFIFRKVTV